MTNEIVAWDFDVPSDWFRLPLETRGGMRWAAQFANEVAAELEAESELGILATQLEDVQGELADIGDPWLMGLVAVRPDAPLSVGAVISARQLAIDDGGSIDTMEAQLRADADQLADGAASRNTEITRGHVDVGAFVRLVQQVEHVDEGEDLGYVTSRAIYVVFPDGASEVVYFQFTTPDFGYFSNITAETEGIVRTLRVQLGEA